MAHTCTQSVTTHDPSTTFSVTQEMKKLYKVLQCTSLVRCYLSPLSISLSLSLFRVNWSFALLLRCTVPLQQAVRVCTVQQLNRRDWAGDLQLISVKWMRNPRCAAYSPLHGLEGPLQSRGCSLGWHGTQQLTSGWWATLTQARGQLKGPPIPIDVLHPNSSKWKNMIGKNMRKSDIYTERSLACSTFSHRRKYVAKKCCL